MEEYEVGYGKPPKKHRWKPGQSGNPSGKKKHKLPEQLPVMEALAAELCELHAVNINGKKSVMPAAALLVKSTIRDVLKAPLREKLAALRELHKFGVLDAHSVKVCDNEDDDISEFTEEELLLLERTRRFLPDDWNRRNAWRAGRRDGSDALFENDYLEEADGVIEEAEAADDDGKGADSAEGGEAGA